MTTSFLTKTAGAGLGLLLLALVSSNAFAGPGSQFWAQQTAAAKARADAAKQTAAEPAKPAAAPTQLCTGATVLPVTAMKPSQANGRGPLVEVQTGTKTVCHMCPVTTTVRTNSLPNGRGTWTTTEITKTGVEHACSNCTPVATL